MIIYSENRFQVQTITGTGSRFAVPPQPDFTVEGFLEWQLDGTELLPSEPGVNETDKVIQWCVGDEILTLVTTTSSTPITLNQTLQQTLANGNSTGTYSILMNSGSLLYSDANNHILNLDGIGGYITLADSVSGGGLYIKTGSTLFRDNTAALIGGFDSVGLNINTGKVIVSSNTFDNLAGHLSLDYGSQSGYVTLNTDNGVLGSTTSYILMYPDNIQLNSGNALLFGSNLGAALSINNNVVTLQASSNPGDNGIIIRNGYTSLYGSATSSTTSPFNMITPQQRTDGRLLTLNQSWAMVPGVTNPSTTFGNALVSSTGSATQSAIVLPGFSSVTQAVKVLISAYNTTNNTSYASEIFGCFKTTSGTVTQIGTITSTEKSNMSSATSNITTDGSQILIQVSGESGRDINWMVTYNIAST